MRPATASGFAMVALASATLAAGGAHVVEDSEVLEPGLCQVDLWVARFDPGAGYANAAPTCPVVLELHTSFQPASTCAPATSRWRRCSCR